jgi:hypothetical protein
MNYRLTRTWLIASLVTAGVVGTGLITQRRANSQPVKPVKPIVIAVNTDHTLCPSYQGLGVQWDPSFVDYTPAQWKLIFQRVSILRPQFIRCCFMATSYCTGFNAQGEPVFNWNSPEMRRLYPILDYCQSHHITVLLGEWGAPFGMRIDDPRWSSIIADGLNYLIRSRGYTCIRWYNKQNEPRGDDEYFQQWRTSQLSLHNALTAAHLGKFVQQVGPDTSGEGLFSWVQMCAQQLPQAIGEYELHWYATDDNITSDHVESALRIEHELVNSMDPYGRLKPFILGESGTSDTLASQTGNWKNGDSNILIHSPRYGTLMADYAVQTMRAGLSGMSAWDLDDSMHEQMGGGATKSVSNPTSYNLKVWGFWNTLGPAMGEPADIELRPWFYAWTMLARHFPRGARIVLTNNPDVEGVRSCAAVISRNGTYRLSVAMVNDSHTAHTVRLVVPNAIGKLDIKQFDYSATMLKATKAGLPLPHRFLHGIRLNGGVEVHLPAESFVVLTTDNSASQLKLTTGRVVSTSHIGLYSADGTSVILPGTRLQFYADVQPEQVPVRWKVTSLNGVPTSLASVDQQGLVTGVHVGNVLLEATSTAPGGVKAARIELHIADTKSLTDHITDWTKTYSHTTGLTFDNLHAAQFEGQAVRVKRESNTPQSVVYKLVHLTGFTIKAFYTGSFSDQVTAAVSSDGVHWSKVTVVHSVPNANGMFKPTAVTPVSPLPPANFLRITLQNNAVIYAPQLAEVTLKASVRVH